MKKVLIIFSFVFNLVFISYLFDWIICRSIWENLIYPDYNRFLQKYNAHFPQWMKPVTVGHPLLLALAGILCLVFSGVIFCLSDKPKLKILGIADFLLAALFLFSLM